RDMNSRFWITYERVAKQNDDEFLDRHNGDLDVQLIFAGLFLAVNSTFIVDMESDWTANSADTTNTLLDFLVQAAYSKTTPDQSILAPSFPGPSTADILSLLAAFSAVLGKQW
ncbi:hypothetical protein M422DRAFT_142698, partial [Sphaerobolus stellatus SS14]